MALRPINQLLKSPACTLNLKGLPMRWLKVPECNPENEVLLHIQLQVIPEYMLRSA